MARNKEPRIYTFGPRETSGWIGNAGPRELGPLALLLAAAVLVLYNVKSVYVLILVLVIGVLAVFATFTKLADKTPLQWIGVARRYRDRKRHGNRMTRLATSAAVSGKGTRLSEPKLPPSLRNVTLGGFDTAGGRMGVMFDGKAVVAALSITGPVQAFPMLDGEVQEALLDDWSRLIGKLCSRNSPMVSFQAIDTTAVGGDGKLVTTLEATKPAEGFRQFFSTRKRNAEPQPEPVSPALAAYRDLIGTATKTAEVHEMTAVIRVDCSRSGRLVRKAKTNGRGSFDFGQLVLLQRAVEQTARSLKNLGIDVAGVHSPESYSLLVHTMMNPAERFAAARRKISGLVTGLAPVSMWPVATDERWSTFRSDGAISLTAAATELNRQGVAADFLTPLIMAGGQNRTVSVTFVGLDPEVARRQAQHTSQNREGTTDTKANAGFRTSADARNRLREAQRHEEELAAGYNDVRVVVHATVSAPTRRALDPAWDAVEESAALSGIRLTPMFGEQEIGRTYTLPLARGVQAIPLRNRVPAEALRDSHLRTSEEEDPWEDGELLSTEELEKLDEQGQPITPDKRAEEQQQDEEEAAKAAAESGGATPVITPAPEEAPAPRRRTRKAAAPKVETPEVTVQLDKDPEPATPSDTPAEPVTEAPVRKATARKTTTRKTTAKAAGPLTNWNPGVTKDGNDEGEAQSA